MWSGTEGFAELNDTVFPWLPCSLGKMSSGIYVEQTNGLGG